MAPKKPISYQDILRSSQTSGIRPTPRTTSKPRPARKTPPLQRGSVNRATPFNQSPIGQATMMQRQSSGSLAKTGSAIGQFLRDVNVGMEQIARDVNQTLRPIESGARQGARKVAGRGVRGNRAWSAGRSSPTVPTSPSRAGSQATSPRKQGGPIAPPRKAGPQAVRGSAYRPGGVEAARASVPTFMQAPPEPPKFGVSGDVATRRSAAGRQMRSVVRDAGSSGRTVKTPESLRPAIQRADRNTAYRGSVRANEPTYFMGRSGLFRSNEYGIWKGLDPQNTSTILDQKPALPRSKNPVESVLRQHDVTSTRNVASEPAPNRGTRIATRVDDFRAGPKAIASTAMRNSLYGRPQTNWFPNLGTREQPVRVNTNKSGMQSNMYRRVVRQRAEAAVKLGWTDNYGPHRSVKYGTQLPKPKKELSPAGPAVRGPVPGPPPSTNANFDPSKTPDQTPEKAETHTTKKSNMGGIKFTMPAVPKKIVAPAVAGTTKPSTTTVKKGGKRVEKATPTPLQRAVAGGPSAKIILKDEGLTATVKGRQVDIFHTDTGKPFRPMMQLPYNPSRRTKVDPRQVGAVIKSIVADQVSKVQEPTEKRVAQHVKTTKEQTGAKITPAEARRHIIAQRTAKARKFDNWVLGGGKPAGERSAAQAARSAMFASNRTALIKSLREAGILGTPDGKRMPKPSAAKDAKKEKRAVARSDRASGRAAAGRVLRGGGAAMGVVGAVPSIVHLARGGSLSSLAGPLPEQFRKKPRTPVEW